MQFRMSAFFLIHSRRCCKLCLRFVSVSRSSLPAILNNSSASKDFFSVSKLMSALLKLSHQIFDWISWVEVIWKKDPLYLTSLLNFIYISLRKCTNILAHFIFISKIIFIIYRLRALSTFYF